MPSLEKHEGWGNQVVIMQAGAKLDGATSWPPDWLVLREL